MNCWIERYEVNAQVLHALFYDECVPPPPTYQLTNTSAAIPSTTLEIKTINIRVNNPTCTFPTPFHCFRKITTKVDFSLSSFLRILFIQNKMCYFFFYLRNPENI